MTLSRRCLSVWTITRPRGWATSAAWGGVLRLLHGTRALLSSIAAIALVVRAAHGQPIPSFSDVLQLQEDYFAQIQSLELEAELQTVLDACLLSGPDALTGRLGAPTGRLVDTGRVTCRMGFSGTRFYTERLPEPLDGTLGRVAFDGSQYMWIAPGPRVISFSSRPPSRNPEGGNNPLLRPYCWALPRNDAAFMAQIRRRETFDPSRFTVTAGEAATVRGLNCAVYTFRQVSAEASQFQVSFAEQYSYYPIQIIETPAVSPAPVTDGAGTAVEIPELTSLESAGNRLAFPVRIRVATWTGSNSLLVSSECVVRLGAPLRLNQEVDPVKFTLPRRIQGYRLQDVDGNRYIDDGISPQELAQWSENLFSGQLPASGEFRTLSSDVESTAARSRRLLLWGCLLGLGLVGAGILLLMRRA